MVRRLYFEYLEYNDPEPCSIKRMCCYRNALSARVREPLSVAAGRTVFIHTTMSAPKRQVWL